MKNVVSTSSLTVVALVIGALSAQAGQPPLLPAPAPTGLTASTYAVGDRLKIAFFEEVPGSGAPGSMAGLIERSELSGDYVVQTDGSVTLPLVGSLAMVGQTVAQIEEAATAEYTRRWGGGPIRVAIHLVDREPVYVSGPVPKPGTYKFVPGMTVIHALTLADGDVPSADQWKLLDTTRERERLNKSSERIRRLQAKAEVLRAEREGRDPSATLQLASTNGDAPAPELIATESNFRSLERQRRELQLAAADRIAAQAKAELVLLREKLAHHEAVLREKFDRVNEVQALKARGATTDMVIHMARSELGEARGRWHEARLIVAQTERRLSDSAQEKARITVEATIDRERELKDIAQAVAEEEITRATIGHLLATSTFAVPEARRYPLSYHILRRTQAGLRRIPAEDVTELEPGDVVLVANDRAAVAGVRDPGASN